MQDNLKYIAFAGNQNIAAGSLANVAYEAKKYLLENESVNILIFEDKNSRVIDLDLRGTPDQVRNRLIESNSIKKARGRPKLGVVSKEITLLPKHWDWLAQQRGGASATLRRLVGAARKKQGGDNSKEIQDSIYRFMTDLAGDFMNYEEALRALYANDSDRLTQLIENWPNDIREHIQDKLAEL